MPAAFVILTTHRTLVAGRWRILSLSHTGRPGAFETDLNHAEKGAYEGVIRAHDPNTSSIGIDRIAGSVDS
ncbi:MAG: hypothetical protein GTN72_07055 [Candidatus Latescibacteria bacterium]|nr:hypothetical protein [Candidatus Latescibacterota bacterium]